MFMGWKDCQRPHGCDWATGQEPQFTVWVQNLALAIAALCLLAAIGLAG